MSPDEAAYILPRMYAERQKHFIAAISSTANRPVPLQIDSNVTTQATIPPDAAEFRNFVVHLFAEALRIGDQSSVTAQGPILRVTTPRPPRAAEFLLRLCATSIHDESCAGCINERFGHNCADGDHARARCLYWADVLGYLLRQLPRALKLTVIIGAIKRLFS
jgi:hypothetical protein